MDIIERAAKRIPVGQKPSAADPESKPATEAPVLQAKDQDSEKILQPSDKPRVGALEETDESHTPPQSQMLDIDIRRIERLGFLSPCHPVTRATEEFRVLKRRILTNIVNDKGSQAATNNIVMVTSTQPREGKTFTAINLALSIATERDKYVLLVDGDFAKPGLFATLGLERRDGFLDVLRKPDLELGDVIFRTNVERLSLIDSGRSSAISSEFLSSEKMQRLVAEIATRYDDRVIIFDSAPLLASSEPSILSHYAGQILFIVEARRTSQRAVTAGLELIYEQDKVMMVLNKTGSVIGSQAFGSYYHYYGKAERKDEPSERKPKPRSRLFARR